MSSKVKYLVGRGWWSLVDEYIEKLKAAGAVIRYGPYEKYGSCRIILEKETDELSDLLLELENKSEHICENCGQSGMLREDLPHIKTLCDICYKPAVNAEIQEKVNLEFMKRFLFNSNTIEGSPLSDQEVRKLLEDTCLRLAVKDFFTDRFVDKFKLTREQSIFLATQRKKDVIYCAMLLEKRNLTFAQVQTLIHGTRIPAISSEDTQAVLDMHIAWRAMLNSLDKPVKVNNDVIGVLKSDLTNTEKAFAVFLWEIWSRGNVREALLLANQVLITLGNGLLAITEDKIELFANLFSTYRVTGAGIEIKKFLYENALFGITPTIKISP